MNYDRDTCRECGAEIDSQGQRAKGVCADCDDGVLQK